METSLARRVWQALEPVHAIVYFVPEPTERYEALGLERIAHYFASRAAPMGAVEHQVVTATFYNFSPGLVRRAMRDAWSTATSAQILEARHDGVRAALERCTAGQSLEPAVGEIAALLAPATALLETAGRPLFAGHASLPLPDDPLLAMWHQLTLLREHRGDGHVIALAAHGFGPMDALLTSAGWSKLDMAQLRKLRGWRPEQWEEGAERCAERGWLDAGGSLTPAGHEARLEVERLTDELAMAPIRTLGEEGANRLLDLLAPLGEAVRRGGGLPS